MGKIYDTITDDLRSWIEKQQMFFVASAPLAADGMINCSPKGMDSFRILGDRRAAYLDLTGSGVETIAHLRENGRIVVMFCAFEGGPQIVRLHGTGKAVTLDDPEFEELAALFPNFGGARSIITIDVTRISDSCGYGVPLYDLIGPRQTLSKWAKSKSPEELKAYQQDNNRESIDGLPGLD